MTKNNWKKGKTKVISHLTPHESSSILSTLLEKNPRLTRKAEKLAQNLLKNVSVEEIAEDVRDALQTIDDLDNLNNRAGSHSWGYVEPSDAASELCEEAVEEFFSDMKRRLEIGDITGAATVCQGIVSGLYEIKGEDGAVLDWAGEDTMCDLAGHAVETLLKAVPKQKRQDLLRDQFLSETFLTTTVSKWADWLRKYQRRIREK